MNYSIKASLLSALIFPGLGQLLLRHYKTGLAMMIIAFTCIATVVSQAFSKALSIAHQIEQNGGMLDEATISSSIELASQNYDNQLVNLAMLGLVLCWLVSVVHAYMAGKARDLAERNTGNSQ